MVRVLESAFVSEFNDLAEANHQNSLAKGFWKDDQQRIEDDLNKLMLTVSELGECAEGLRHGNPPSDHIPEFSAAEEEMADAVIRIMDHCRRRGWRIAEAIEAKMVFNGNRPFLHNKLA